MRILLVSLSLFAAQNTLTNDFMTKAMATGITLTMASGIITELLYPTPIPKDPSKDYGAGNPCIGMAIAVFNIAMAIYNSQEVHEYTPFCVFVFSVYGHMFAATGTRYIKNKLLSCYNKNENTERKL
jgi:hypothetical protein